MRQRAKDELRRGRAPTATHRLPLPVVLAVTLVWAGCNEGTEPTGTLPDGDLVLSSRSVTFEGDAGGSPPGAFTIDVTSDGEPVSGLSVEVQYPEIGPTGWVDASLDATTTPATLSVTLSTSVLAWGGYAASLGVTGANAGNGAQLVVVSVSLSCPPPVSGRVTVCGSLRDTETGEAVNAPLSVVGYDLVEFAGDPTGATALATAVSDASGRFRFRDIAAPGFGYLLMIAEDGAGADFVPTGGSLPATGGTYESTADLFATRGATDVAWTASAGDPFGAGTFASEGSILSIFRHDGSPVSGVEVTGGSSPTSYYFSDSDASVRSQVSATATATGASGSALTLGGGLDDYSGAGSEPAGSVWSSVLAADIPGLVLVISHTAVTP